MCRTWGMHFFTMYDTYHPADFAAEALDGRIYTTLRFCNMEALDTMIKLLQDTKKMWEADIHNRK